MNSISSHVKGSARKAQKKHLNLHGRPVFLNSEHPLPDNIDLQSVLDKVNMTIPRHLTGELDVVYVGDFDFFKETDTNAAYQSGAIYISNTQDDDDDILDDLVHEIAHCAEASFPNQIYSDGQLEKDFLFRRQRLKSILRSHEYDVEKYDFENPDFDRELDIFLFEVVGYEALGSLTEGLFCSVYGATSLKEYWATAFEEYFLGDRKYVYNISKILYNKIHELVNYQHQQS